MFGTVNLHLESLKPLTSELRTIFQRVRYLPAKRGVHSVAPYLAEKFRLAGEAAVEPYVERGAELVCEAPAPDERTFRMGCFARARACTIAIFSIDRQAELPVQGNNLRSERGLRLSRLIRAASLACQNQRKAPKFARNRESIWESRK